jgi:hypothetical protein
MNDKHHHITAHIDDMLLFLDWVDATGLVGITKLLLSLTLALVIDCSTAAGDCGLGFTALSWPRVPFLLSASSCNQITGVVG